VAAEYFQMPPAILLIYRDKRIAIANPLHAGRLYFHSIFRVDTALLRAIDRHDQSRPVILDRTFLPIPLSYLLFIQT